MADKYDIDQLIENFRPKNNGDASSPHSTRANGDDITIDKSVMETVKVLSASVQLLHENQSKLEREIASLRAGRSGRASLQLEGPARQSTGANDGSDDTAIPAAPPKGPTGGLSELSRQIAFLKDRLRLVEERVDSHHSEASQQAADFKSLIQGVESNLQSQLAEQQLASVRQRVLLSTPMDLLKYQVHELFEHLIQRESGNPRAYKSCESRKAKLIENEAKSVYWRDKIINASQLFDPQQALAEVKALEMQIDTMKSNGILARVEDRQQKPLNVSLTALSRYARWIFDGLKTYVSKPTAGRPVAAKPVTDGQVRALAKLHGGHSAQQKRRAEALDNNSHHNRDQAAKRRRDSGQQRERGASGVQRDLVEDEWTHDRAWEERHVSGGIMWEREQSPRRYSSQHWEPDLRSGLRPGGYSSQHWEPEMEPRRALYPRRPPLFQNDAEHERGRLVRHSSHDQLP